ncbi:flagellar assembly protein A [Candidatus Latescibacterota bacterium]
MNEDKQDVDILIEVSGDNFEVYITLNPQTENTELTTEKIGKALSDKGIVFGIKKEVLEQFDKDITYNKRLLIASGTKPAEGKDGIVEYTFESNKTVKVKKGETIGKIIPPVDGIEGITVFDKKIPSRKAQKAQMPKLANVEISPEKEDILVAKIDGYLHIDQLNVQIKPFFELEISDDKYEAYVTVHKPLADDGLDAEDLKKFLAANGIVHGINDEKIENIFKEMIFEKTDERQLIASGTKPTEGKDGTVEYAFESGKTVKVKKGETIGKIIHPVEGVEGITVFGDKIYPQQVEKAHIPELTNIEISPEHEDILIAKIDGYLFIDELSVQIKPFFELEISDDKYEAYVKVHKPINDGDFISEDLKGFLTEKGVTYGILNEEIENIFKQEIFDKNILVARGQKVVDEKDGETRYYFATKIKPKVDEKGNIDYKELNLIHNVTAGEKLAEIIPPKPGVEGITIFNENISPKKGVQPQLPVGKNTCPDANDPNILLSEIEGNVKLRGTTVEVESVFVIRENVDFSTGNIDFKGSVVVNGDVKSGFKIKSQGDVQVNGIVEDAVIESEGNVLLKTGFIGKGSGQIIAKGDVTAKFCENQKIIADGDIYISEYVMHCNIQTNGKLFMTEKTGLIIGGEIYAVKGIEAKTVGNDNYTPTALFVGVDKEFNEKLSVTKNHLAKIIEYQKNIEKILHKFSRIELLKKELPEKKKNMMNNLNNIKDEKEIEKKNTIVGVEKLQSKIDEFKEATVKIFDVVYPGTLINIYNKHIVVNDSVKSVYYKYKDNAEELIAADLEELE